MNFLSTLFLGDSLTTGAREPLGMSWPLYFAHAALADGVVVLPHIEAENGRRSPELARVALPAIQRSQAKEAFVLIGTNDAKDDGTVPTEVTVANIALVCAWCRTAGTRPYVLTVPVPAGFGSPGYTAAIGQRIRALNDAIRAHGFPHLVECADLRDTTDGIHLGTASARELAERAWAAVKATRTFT